LRLDTLDVLICVSFVGLAPTLLDQEKIFIAWKDVKNMKVLENMYLF
jgi:hypothetical protein